MKSTPRQACVRAMLLLWLCALAAPPLLASESAMPQPAALEADVQFWIRVYTQIDTNAGFLHDQYNLGTVYETLHFAPDASQSAREHEVDEHRERIAAALRRIAAAGDAPL